MIQTAERAAALQLGGFAQAAAATIRKRIIGGDEVTARDLIRNSTALQLEPLMPKLNFQGVIEKLLVPVAEGTPGQPMAQNLRTTWLAADTYWRDLKLKGGNWNTLRLRILDFAGACKSYSEAP
jgi:hypothetical protein